MFQGNGNDSWISLDDMGENIINATLSIEDIFFYKHWGFDFPRIGAAILANFSSGEIVQGASTITQQYAKNLFLNFDKSWKRKWKEMWLTYDLEFHYDKEEILEGYLNTINYLNFYRKKYPHFLWVFLILLNVVHYEHLFLPPLFPPALFLPM